MNKLITIILSCVLIALSSCSSVSHLEEDEQLFTGLKKIDYVTPSNTADAEEISGHITDTKAEVEAALATAPNGALFGSSYYRTPFPYGLWIWNAYSHRSGAFAKWLTSSFGKAPVLMQNVNPALRASVAKTVLQNNGFFHGDVTYDVIEGKPQTTKTDSVLKPRTAKIQYHVNFGSLYPLDSVSYSPELKAYSERPLTKGQPFSISSLEEERQRIYKKKRDNGYYYYQPSNIVFLADTLMVPGKVQLRVWQADSLPPEAEKQWKIGSTTVQIRRQFMEMLTDSLQHRFLKIKFNGAKPPIRPRIVLSDTRLRPGMLFSQEAYEESLNRLASKDVFSSVDISFTPRQDADSTGVLDMTINTVLDKPYDLTFQADVIGKTSRRVGPGVSISLTKRNAFRGGEKFSINAGANYEFQLGGQASMGNSYDFSLGTSIDFPRLIVPKFITKRRRWYTTPSTLIDVNATLTRRAGFFNRILLSAEYAYVFQPTASSIHKFSPLMLAYGRTTNKTAEYEEKMSKTAIGIIALQDELIPRMRYTYIYATPRTSSLYFTATVTQAGAITNLLSTAFTHHAWGDRGKKILGTPFSQFVKLEADIRKTWKIGSHDAFVFHFYGGIMGAYGNDNSGPFSELLYISGHNDLRAFTQRSIGPGDNHNTDRQLAYLFGGGDLKLVVNLEYRPRLFGSLYGAVFLDAGNIWYLKHDIREEYKQNFDANTVKRDIAVNTGIGIRYDLDYFVLRLDWGIGLHVPYKTSHSGFFNIPNFKDAQCLNFSIGYPF